MPFGWCHFSVDANSNYYKYMLFDAFKFSKLVNANWNKLLLSESRKKIKKNITNFFTHLVKYLFLKTWRSTRQQQKTTDFVPSIHCLISTRLYSDCILWHKRLLYFLFQNHKNSWNFLLQKISIFMFRMFYQLILASITTHSYVTQPTSKQKSNSKKISSLLLNAFFSSITFTPRLMIMN